VNLCRCPHCQATFQVNIPYDSHYWEDAATDEDGFAVWVCLACRKRGLPDVKARDVRRSGHDTSHRAAHSWQPTRAGVQ
jgi:hypothetical protein